MHERGFYKAAVIPDAAVLECSRKKKKDSVLFLVCLSSPGSYHLSQRDHIKGLASALTIPVSCTGIIRPLPLPSPEMTPPPPFFSPRLSSTSEDHSGLLSIIQHAWRHPMTWIEAKPTRGRNRHTGTMIGQDANSLISLCSLYVFC